MAFLLLTSAGCSFIEIILYVRECLVIYIRMSVLLIYGRGPAARNIRRSLLSQLYHHCNYRRRVPRAPNSWSDDPASHWKSQGNQWRLSQHQNYLRCSWWSAVFNQAVCLEDNRRMPLRSGKEHRQDMTTGTTPCNTLESMEKRQAELEDQHRRWVQERSLYEYKENDTDLDRQEHVSQSPPRQQPRRQSSARPTDSVDCYTIAATVESARKELDTDP
jgi:hypothetical protein